MDMFKRLMRIRLGPVESLALASGVAGMLLCLSALLLGIGLTIEASPALNFHIQHFEQESGLALFAKSPGLATKLMMLELGAVLLLLSALSRGKDGRLYQVLEVSLVLQGALYFVPLDESEKFYGRVVLSTAIFTTLWHFGLLSGVLNKVGAAGLELLGFGYLFNEPVYFALGGILLSVSSMVSYHRHRHWIDLLWTCLNVPFALAALAEWLLRLRSLLGYHEVGLILLSCAISGVASVILWIGFHAHGINLDAPEKAAPATSRRDELGWT